MTRKKEARLADAEEGHFVSSQDSLLGDEPRPPPPADLSTQQASLVSSPSGLHCCSESTTVSSEAFLSGQGGWFSALCPSLLEQVCTSSSLH